MAAQLSAQYRIVGASFWRGENLLDAQITTLSDRNALLASPIAAGTMAGLEYSRAASAADSFLKLADQNNISNWMSDPVVYFGALSHYTIGNYARAAELFARLAPDYQRDLYINDRDPANPEYSVPTKPGISKLLFYARLKSLLATSADRPDDAFAALQNITREALSTLAAQHEYAFYLANRPSIHDQRDWSESVFGGEPDQRRAGALPPTLQLVEAAWDSLLEKAVQKDATATRDFLRGLSTPDAPLSTLAADKLQIIDALIIKAYFAEAQNLMDGKNFDGARAKFRQIMAEYSGSEAAKRAEDELPKIVPVAIEYYKSEGDKNFRPADNGQFLPLAKSRELYEKMYNEDPNGPQADYALFHWSRALGTEGKAEQETKQLQEFLLRFQDSPLRPQAAYLLGFIQGSHLSRKYGEAIKQMNEVVKQYSDSKEAPEALWHAAFFCAFDGNRYQDGLPYLEKLQAEYPGSPRWPYVAEWIQKFKERAKE